MTAHFGVFAGGLFLLLSLMQMGTADTARRMRAEQELQSSNEALEARVAARTVELAVGSTKICVAKCSVRQVAEDSAVRSGSTCARITHAVAERQDLDSIFQVWCAVSKIICRSTSPRCASTSITRAFSP